MRGKDKRESRIAGKSRKTPEGEPGKNRLGPLYERLFFRFPLAFDAGVAYRYERLFCQN